MASARRKSAAIALAVVGVAGLSLASAAQLNVTADTIQAGSAPQANCQGATPVDVNFDSGWDGTRFAVTSVAISGVAQACIDEGARMEFTVLDVNDAVIFTSDEAAAANGSFAVTSTAAAAVGSVAVVIH